MFIVLFSIQILTNAQLTPLPDDPLDINKQARTGTTLQQFGCEIVIVGSATGCVVGWKMVKAGYKTCILEAGGTDNYFEVKWGLLAPAVIFNPDTSWGLMNSQPELDAVNNTIFLPSGKLWGGSYAHNSMVPGRGDGFTYDQWVEVGATGWSADEVLPFYKEIEGYLVRPPTYAPPKRYHNVDGSWPINYQPFTHHVSLTMKQAALNMGIPDEKDANDYHPYGAWNPTMNHKEGLRVTPCNALFTPDIMNSSNLFIALNSEAINVIFDSDNETAIGILYNNKTDGQNYTVYGSRQIVVSAGAYNTPKVLMLSGIGPKDHLDNFSIPVKADRQGVGKNLQDHALGGPVWNVTDTPIVTLESWFEPFGDGSRCGTGIVNYDPCLSPGGEFYAFINTRLFNLNCTNSLLDWNRCCPSDGTAPFTQNGKPSLDPCRRISDVDIECAPGLYIKGGSISIPGVKGLSCGPNTGTPAVGTVRLSSSDYTQSVTVDHGYLRKPRQMREFVDGIIISRQLLNETVKLEVGESYLSRVNEIIPGAQYQSREELEEKAKEIVSFGAHYSGTARMGFRNDPDAVVDHRLRVIKNATTNFKRLRVMDNSVIPILPHSNSMWYSVMIGLKGARMLIEDLYYE